MRTIKFISYDGNFPNLCGGTLVLEIDGEIYREQYVLSSGGGVYYNPEDCSIDIESGDWSLSEFCELYKMLSEEEREYVENLINNNVEQGCCGGCS